MAKFVCSVCGYVYEGDAAPEKCPYAMPRLRNLSNKKKER